MANMIKVGNTTINGNVFDGLTLSEAYEKFGNLSKEVVKVAYLQANPKKRSKPKPKK